MEESPGALATEAVALRDYLDAVCTDKAYTIFERCMNPLVRLIMREHFPELPRDGDGRSDDEYVRKFEEEHPPAGDPEALKNDLADLAGKEGQLKILTELKEAVKDEGRPAQLWKRIFAEEAADLQANY